MIWECQACSYIYDPKNSDEVSAVGEGTDFAVLPVDWACPVCGVGKEFFENISGGSN